jgi:hypothetical protein
MHLNNAPSENEQPEGVIYKNMSVANINLDADRISIKDDTLTFRVNNFSFTERSGLNIVQMTADTGIIRFGREVTLREFRVIDDFSNVKMRNLSLLYNEGKDFSDFINKVNLAVDIYDSHVDFRTLGYFAPALNRIPVTARFNGQITGHIADLRSDSFTLETFGNTYINGRFSIFGLPDIESTMIFVDLKHLDTHSNDVATIVESVTGKRFAAKESLDKFGYMHFNGTYTGLINDFVSYGYLKSDLGVLEMDILLKNQKTITTFSGELATDNFDVGNLIRSPLIGHAGFKVEVDGAIQSGKNDIFGKGSISFLEFNDYRYRNVELEGRLVNQSFDGRVTISEPNLDLDFNGNIDIDGDGNSPIFKFDAKLKHADLVKLNFNKRDTVSAIDAQIKANFMASSILDYIGELTVDSLFYTDTRGKVNLGKIVLASYSDENHNALLLESNFMDVEYFGQRDLGGFVEQLLNITQRHVPELFDNVIVNPNLPNPESDYGFDVQVKDASNVARILAPELYIENGAKLNAKIDTSAKITITMSSGRIAYGDNQISDLKLSCDNQQDSLDVNIYGNLITPWLAINNFYLKNSVFHDKIQTRFSFIDSTNNSNTNISFATQFSHNPESKTKLLTDINIDKSSIKLFGQEWDLTPASVKIGDEKFSVAGFNLNRQGQQVGISGTVSQNSSDSLRIFLTNYRLRGFNQYISQLGYEIDGQISGEIDLYGLYETPFIISSILVDTLVVNSDTIGNLTLGSMWNNDKQCIDVTSRISYDNQLYSSIYGYVFPSTGEIEADLNVKNFKIRTIEPLLTNILSDISGMLNGSVKIKGTFTNPDISGEMNLDNVGLTIDYLKTHYVVNSSIDITGSKISIKNGNIKDMAGNTGTLNLNLTHNYFKNIQFDASANVANFLSLNTKSVDNPLFYGTAYTSGVVNLTGEPELINLAITAETGSNSFFYIPLSSTSQVKESNFLTFANSKADAAVEEKFREILPDKASNMKLSFDLGVTPKSEIQILIDPKVGDILRARGNGNLKIYVDPALEEFNITGDYLIEEGDYNFTLPNISIVSRKFVINRGSRIRFNGDITNAELNVTASYKERVSLAKLFPDDSLRNHPVECQIFITGRMTNPLLKFDINIRDIDPEKKAQFANLVNTDEKMTRQFLSLLVLKAFLPEQNFATQDLGSTPLMYNASELLSGQIGNLISMFNLPIPLDVNVDYNSNAHNSAGAGFGIDVSAQLFDRVLLNGSASNTTTSNRSFVGDVEMEVLLGKNQNTRFKVFSKSRDYFSDDMESNRNGIGLSYRSQFDRFIDLFRRKKKKEKIERSGK